MEPDTSIRSLEEGNGPAGDRPHAPSPSPSGDVSPRTSAWSTGRQRSAILYLLTPILAGGALAATVGLSLGSFAGYIPTAAVDLFYSFLRMCAAYVASLGFALAYGYYAATRPQGERVMIPVLDILQSVPILGFFPVAIVALADLTPNSWVGPNIASVFLIFTSMSWNMVFGVYESVKTLPIDLREATDSFGVRGMQRFRQVLFPAMVNRLVYNSVLSWTAGWFFLVEAEIFTTNKGGALPGIGSYLSFAAGGHNGTAFLTGLVLLVILIALLDFGVWRPLGRFAERFRYDSSPSGEGDLGSLGLTTTRFRRAAAYITRGVRSGVTRVGTPLVQFAAIPFRSTAGRLRRNEHHPALYYGILGGILVGVWLLLIAIIVAIFNVFSSPLIPSVRGQILELPLAMGASLIRVVVAFAFCLAIALPLAVLMSRRPRAARVGLPVVEVIASFPATALFPVIIFELLPYISGEGAAVLMLMTGMLWYLFFNLLSGIRSLPPDLEEASRSFGVKGRGFFTKVLLPGIFPALITGSITAFGGGWNTLIVAEYLNVGASQKFQLLGVGSAIDIGYAEPNGLPLMVAALLTLVITVIAINELIWKPLYRRAVEKYRYD
ncbi:MAG: ABC transporter permease subunit [Thermoplasmata archaeon]|jgi:NitT/TauT family transport system permease protein|nr:ABC transporter permease subunit [Thermoplasmata archaeon]